MTKLTQTTKPRLTIERIPRDWRPLPAATIVRYDGIGIISSLKRLSTGVGVRLWVIAHLLNILDPD